jgi:hypothetical protein
VNATSTVSIADVNFARMSAMANDTFEPAAFQPAPVGRPPYSVILPGE